MTIRFKVALKRRLKELLAQLDYVRQLDAELAAISNSTDELDIDSLKVTLDDIHDAAQMLADDAYEAAKGVQEMIRMQASPSRPRPKR